MLFHSPAAPGHAFACPSCPSYSIPSRCRSMLINALATLSVSTAFFALHHHANPLLIESLRLRCRSQLYRARLFLSKPLPCSTVPLPCIRTHAVSLPSQLCHCVSRRCFSIAQIFSQTKRPFEAFRHCPSPRSLP